MVQIKKAVFVTIALIFVAMPFLANLNRIDLPPLRLNMYYLDFPFCYSEVLRQGQPVIVKTHERSFDDLKMVLSYLTARCRADNLNGVTVHSVCVKQNALASEEHWDEVACTN